ncbi:MAG: recombinase family protein [Candidatus Peregrinibacteria bacterium]
MQIIGYIRVSTEGQTEGFGLAEQEDRIKAYVKEGGHTLLRIFREEGVSGSLAKRPALGELFEYIKAHKVDAVVFLRLDRLSRNLLLSEQLLLDFQQLNVQPISLDEPDLDSQDPSRILFRQMKGMLSEYEKSMITVRMSAGRIKKVETGGGFAGGNVAFGFRAEGDNYVPVEQELTIVREIYKLRRKPRHGKRMSYQKIADYLNEKYDLRRFSAMSCRYIATNDFYMGIQRYGGVEAYHPSLKVL